MRIEIWDLSFKKAKGINMRFAALVQEHAPKAGLACALQKQIAGLWPPAGCSKAPTTKKPARAHAPRNAAEAAQPSHGVSSVRAGVLEPGVAQASARAGPAKQLLASLVAKSYCPHIIVSTPGCS